MTAISSFAREASTMASRVDGLMLAAILVAVFFASLIALFILYFALRYHHSKDIDRSNPVTMNVPLEIIWTGVPLLICLGLFIAGARVFVDMSEPPRDAITMYVVAKQWMWKMQHPEGKREINELHVPVGYPVKLLMTSEDVIHSFFVPAFRLKQDVLPGRYTMLWFQATEAGTYTLFCAQYCGTSHSGMIGKIIAMSPGDYQRWVGQETSAKIKPPAPTMASAGAHLFSRYHCDQCHEPRGRGAGPSLVGLFGNPVTLASGRTVVADEEYIRKSILRPNAALAGGYPPIMPTFQGLLGEDDIIQLIAYIESLKGSS